MSALVIDGHPNPDSLTAALARRYAEEHGDARLLALRDLDFDPISYFGYRGEQPLEPDLADALAAVFAADRIVVATPTWWASTPALLKGFFDRLLLPKVTYRYRSNGLPEGLLRGRAGRVIITSDTPRWLLPFTGDTAAKQVAANTLRFCGIRPIRVMRFTNVRHASEATRAGWLDRVAKAAGRDRAASTTATGTPARERQHTRA
ncbi:NAD(P)H-dependent oxidoreductase [Microbacterium halophytorum]|uniref:NAD(P)H-dependent oxidoreductase n=1 Tax=Microbacterium halophytorum TaxID=2067568 RepID=UPI000CFC546C|nr:NAD(P)H-dependent oxidoreductase [Microbacterium halophytorum]